ncbi:MAG: hypothetical protein K1X74_00100 [Pirellulales bacterium]|nr:hypothetical protein [Pirellulales bacterium]
MSLVLHGAAILTLGLVVLPTPHADSVVRWIALATGRPESSPVESLIELPPASGKQGAPPASSDTVQALTAPADGTRVEVALAEHAAMNLPPDALPAAANLAQPLPKRAAAAARQAGTAARPVSVPAQSPAGQSGGPQPAEVRQFYDAIVDRFIQYDLGELNGQAGMQARAAFHALGPDAVPSLISGLNYSASIQASCPVVVLRSKLRSLLAATMDSEQIDRAIQELCKGVSPAAPHAALVAELREELLRFRQSELAAQAMTTVQRLARENRKTVQAALTDPEPMVRWAATRVVAERGLRLIDELLTLLDDVHPDVQQEARGALVRLARGKDFGPAPKATDEQHAAAVAQWREWAAKFHPESHDEEDDHLPDDPAQAAEQRAASQLSLAERLEERGLKAQAKRRYTELVANYPDTQAAAEGRRRLAEN